MDSSETEHNIKEYEAIILSAGFSSRMGEFKPLLGLGNSKVVKVAIKSFQRAGIENITVVVGHRGNEVIEELKDEKIDIVINNNYEEGMYSSVVAGVSKLKPHSKGFFMLPVDNPLVREKTITDIIAKFNEDNYDIVYPTFNGKRGHPPLININLKEEIILNNMDGGLRNLLKLHEEKAAEIGTYDMGSIMDMDRPEDYEVIKSYYKRLNIPTEEECTALLNKYVNNEKIIKHSVKVAELSLYLADILINKNINIDKELLKASALLHDIKRVEKNHDRVGGQFLKELGFKEVGKIIENHMNIVEVKKDGIDEEEILYLSDKLTKEDKIIKLKDRKEEMEKKFKGNKEALKNINERFYKVELIIKKLEEIIGQSLDNILLKIGE